MIDMNIPLSRPFIKKQLILKEIETVLDSRWISGGPAIKRFEDAVQSYNNDPEGHYAAVANASVGLEMALQFLGVEPGMEVIVPSWSWVATGFVVVRCGAIPVWCDVELDGTMNVERVAKLVTEKTKAIILVHQMGVPCDIDAFRVFSDKGIGIIEDAACAFGSEYKGKKIGNSPNIVVYSFQAKKCLTTGEGGMVVSRNRSTTDWFRSMRAFGTNVSPLERDRANFLLKEKFDKIGTNHKISDIQCALGLAHLSYLDEEIDRRAEAARVYYRLISELGVEGYGIQVANIVPDYCTRYNWQNYHVLLSDRYNRDKVIDLLRKSGIGCKWDIQAIHLEPAFGNQFHNIVLPNTERFHTHGLVLPFFAEITVDEQEHVMNTLRTILDQNEVRI